MDPFPIWGDGLETRNFTYVKDTVAGMAPAGAILERFEAVNVGTDSHHTIHELIREIFVSTKWEPRESSSINRSA
jgi:nucleoside-diphosphate-sugar epimerase